MKTLAPCCDEAADRLILADDSGDVGFYAYHDRDPLDPLALGLLVGPVTFCPWCGKRFEVVEAPT